MFGAIIAGRISRSTLAEGEHPASPTLERLDRVLQNARDFLTLRDHGLLTNPFHRHNNYPLPEGEGMTGVLG